MADSNVLQLGALVKTSITDKTKRYLLVESSTTPPTPDSAPVRLSLDELNKSNFDTVHPLTIASGTITTSADALAITQTWNAGAVTFEAICVQITDTASAAASRFAAFQIGSTDTALIMKDGSIRSGNHVTGMAMEIYSTTAAAMARTTTARPWWASSTNSRMALASAWSISWSSSSSDSTTGDLFILRDAANALAQRNGTSAQTLNIYNTYTSGSVYERGYIKWTGNQFEIGTEHTGGSNRDIVFRRNGSAILTMGALTMTVADTVNFVFNTGTGTKFGTATGQKLAFWNSTPIVQPVLATGASATVDNVITVLQNLGLCKQS